MKKILSVLVLLCCMLFVLPVVAEEVAVVEPAAEVAETRAFATLVSDPAELIPVYVDEEAEGAIGSLEQAIADFTIGGTIAGIVKDSGIYNILTGNWKSAIMLLISFVLAYLAIVKKFDADMQAAKAKGKAKTCRQFHHRFQHLADGGGFHILLTLEEASERTQ